MINWISEKHSDKYNPPKVKSTDHGAISSDSHCWETIQVEDYRIIIHNQNYVWGVPDPCIYNWHYYGPPRRSGTTFTLTQE